jgi:choline dehydrogenase-like flavoprotein
MHLGHGYSLHITVIRPKSRGRVWLNSADPAAPPAIDPAFLEDDRDTEKLVQGTKIAQQILRSAAFADVQGKPFYAADTDDDAVLREDIRNRADTQYHPVGTCKMGKDQMAVVDPRLRVYGIKGLRVADASIMPNLVSGNTNAPSIMIGEKCADMVKADWAR